MAEKVQGTEETPKAEGTPTPTPPKRGLGHRGADPRDTAAELAARAHAISIEAGSKMTGAMRDVIHAAAGISNFVASSARDLVQFMVRRGQIGAEDADKMIREAEEAHARRVAGGWEPSGLPPMPETVATAAPVSTPAPVIVATPEPEPAPVAAEAAPEAPRAKPAAKAPAKAPAKAAAKETAPAPAPAKPAAKAPAKPAAKAPAKAAQVKPAAKAPAKPAAKAPAKPAAKAPAKSGAAVKSPAKAAAKATKGAAKAPAKKAAAKKR